MIQSGVFWNKPAKRDAVRAADPLGFDALREAMADTLVPLLTGATVDADEYLVTLVGLRWAHESSGSSVDATIFEEGFAPFERALKQYWYKFRGRKSDGITIVKKLCDGAQPEVGRPILVDQRATGLLGHYVVSLRGMGLVGKGSLRVVEEAAECVLGDMSFSPPRNWASSWSGLKKAFAGMDYKAARRRLGVRLFEGGGDGMTRAARSTLARPTATSWGQVARQYLDTEQARLAGATSPLVRFETRALEVFGGILRGETTLPASTRKTLRFLAAAAQDADPFPANWASDNPLRSAISDALSSVTRGEEAVTALFRLHAAVTRDARRIEPWVSHLGDMPENFQRWQPGGGIPDFRFGNLRTLIRQTGWRPHDS